MLRVFILHLAPSVLRPSLQPLVQHPAPQTRDLETQTVASDKKGLEYRPPSSAILIPKTLHQGARILRKLLLPTIDPTPNTP